MRNKIFILLFLSLSIANTVGGGLAFLNVPGTARMNSLGNTMFSDISNPLQYLLTLQIHGINQAINFHWTM